QCPLLEDPASARVATGPKPAPRPVPVKAKAAPDAAEQPGARSRSSPSRLPLIAAGVGGGGGVVGLPAGLLAWGARPSPEKPAPGPALARAGTDRGKKRQPVKPVPPTTPPKAAVSSGQPEALPAPFVEEEPKAPVAAAESDGERRFEGHKGPVYAVAFSPG